MTDLPTAVASLYEPYEMKGLAIKNRFMRSPMVLSMAAPDGTVTDDLLRMYRTVAEGGVGLCCTGCMAVNPEARMNWQQMGVWSDAQIPGLAALADTVHAYGDGCVFFAQIFSEGAHSWGYSYGQEDAGLDVNTLDDEQIRFIIEAFAAGAHRVRTAGFDGVHLHGGHGYLISQFLSPAVNRREDAWGGSAERRCTFALEIVRAIRARVGDDYPLGIKMNTADYLPGGHWPQETARLARLLADEGVDLIEMSGGMGYMIELREALRRRAAEREYYFWEAVPAFVKSLAGTGVALAAVGGIRTPHVMAALREQGVDFISMARPWLCEPDLAIRIRKGDLRPAKCVSGHQLCNLCLTKLGRGSVQCERFYPGDCRMACPIEQDNPTYLDHLVKGELAEAVRVVKADNPLANSLSRVCHAPCETACRGKNDEPLSLRDVKRFVVDWGREHGVATHAPRPLRRRRGKVAVVGSGPAGLTCAHTLAQLGYEVTVFERERMAGGMLFWGIPAYRLPKDVLAADLEYVTSSGVVVQTGVHVGRDVSLEELFARGFDAVFLATGAGRSLTLDVEGAELPGVLQGLDLLRAVNQGERPAVGSRVVVIGGGNVALDSAMTARRLGADVVTLVCLEMRDEMPAYADQLADALEEGLVVKNGWGPKRFVGDGAVASVELVRCERVFDDYAAFNPIYCLTDVEPLPADTVLLAIGQRGELDALMEAPPVVPAGDGAFWVHRFTLATAVPGVFAGGDAVGGPGTVADAMAAGKLAAAEIDRYLHAAAVVKPSGDPIEAMAERYAPFIPMVRPTAFKDVAETTLTEGSQRASAPKLPPETRQLGFEEIVGRISHEQAVAQARRCLKYDAELEAESAARLEQMGPAAFVVSVDEDPARRDER